MDFIILLLVLLLWCRLLFVKPKKRRIPKNQAVRCIKCDEIYIVDGYEENRSYIVCDTCREKVESFNSWIKTENERLLAENDRLKKELGIYEKTV